MQYFSYFLYLTNVEVPVIHVRLLDVNVRKICKKKKRNRLSEQRLHYVPCCFCALVEIYVEITASCVIAKVKTTGVPPTEDPCRGSKEKGGTPWWCTPGVIDRAEARGSDSGLTVDSPRSR